MRMLAFAAAAAVLVAAPAFAQSGPPMAHHEMMKMTTLSVTASADAKAAPDLASVSAGVITEGKTAGEALAANAERMNAVFAQLKRAGVPDKDIKTAGLSLNPIYAYPPNEQPVLRGYQAANTVSATIRKLADTGKAIDAIVAAGVNQINSVDFSLSNADEALDGARAEAMKKALARGELYARAAGLRIARIVTITEGAAMTPTPPYPMQMARMTAMDAGAPTPISAGEIGLTATVSVVFELDK